MDSENRDHSRRVPCSSVPGHWKCERKFKHSYMFTWTYADLCPWIIIIIPCRHPVFENFCVYWVKNTGFIAKTDHGLLEDSSSHFTCRTSPTNFSNCLNLWRDYSHFHFHGLIIKICLYYLSISPRHSERIIGWGFLSCVHVQQRPLHTNDKVKICFIINFHNYDNYFCSLLPLLIHILFF